MKVGEKSVGMLPFHWLKVNRKPYDIDWLKQVFVELMYNLIY